MLASQRSELFTSLLTLRNHTSEGMAEDRFFIRFECSYLQIGSKPMPLFIIKCVRANTDKLTLCFSIICGLTQLTSKAHIARACLEAVCFQTAEVSQAEYMNIHAKQYIKSMYRKNT